MNRGYTGKPYDSATGLYDYGYRDYAPAAARFTTVDPIRDGSNWFAYVNNDPVNWVDPWGLSASEKSRVNKAENSFQIGQDMSEEMSENRVLVTEYRVKITDANNDHQFSIHDDTVEYSLTNGIPGIGNPRIANNTTAQERANFYMNYNYVVVPNPLGTSENSITVMDQSPISTVNQWNRLFYDEIRGRNSVETNAINFEDIE
jgi:RHS repeat-associated protein